MFAANLTSSLLFAPLLALGSLAAQTTVVVPCALDNTLYEHPTGSLSNGLGEGLFVGLTGQQSKRRSLVQFDVASHLPAGARVLDARLQVNVTRTAVALTVDVSAHRALSSWGEGSSNAPGQEGGGTPATSGDATWLHRFYPNTAWANAGGDFDPTVSAVISTGTFGTAMSAPSAALARDVQAMLDAPASNFGWLLKTDEAVAYVTRRLGSRESTGPRPTLTVTYVLPGQTGSWGTGCPVNGQPFTHAMVGTPSGGNTLQLTQSQGPGGAVAVNLVGLELDPAGFPLLPQCNLHLPTTGLIVTHGLVVLDAAGAGSAPFGVPSGFAGVMIVSQTAALTNVGGGYVLSNAALAVLQ